VFGLGNPQNKQKKGKENEGGREKKKTRGEGLLYRNEPTPEECPQKKIVEKNKIPREEKRQRAKKKKLGRPDKKNVVITYQEPKFIEVQETQKGQQGKKAPRNRAVPCHKRTLAWVQKDRRNVDQRGK